MRKAMKSKEALVIAALCLFATGAAVAKLPPLSEEQKAKEAESKAKADESAKKEADLLTKAQDRLADRYIKQQKAKGVTVKPTPLAAPPAAATAAAKTVAPAAPELAAAPGAAKKK
jgi:Flp pilus assembly protein TadB